MNDTEIMLRVFTHLTLVMTAPFSVADSSPVRAGQYLLVYPMAPILRDNQNEIAPADRQPPYAAIVTFSPETGWTPQCGQSIDSCRWMPI